MSARADLFGIHIDALDRQQALDQLVRWLDEPQTGRYVVTPNVDHVVKLSVDESFRAAYHAASLVVVDGMPVLWASRLLGRPLPGLVTGSDLAPALMAYGQQRGALRVFLLGAGPGVAATAARRIRSRWPAVDVCGTYSPPIGFERDVAESERILGLLEKANPELLVLGLGAPKQELWAHRSLGRNPARVTLCVGATIDFLAGHLARAPSWLRGTGFEWVHRMATEPARLGPRYLHDALSFPRLLWREWRTRQR